MGAPSREDLIQLLDTRSAELKIAVEDHRDKDATISFLKAKITRMQNQALPEECWANSWDKDARIEELEMQVSSMQQELEVHKRPGASISWELSEAQRKLVERETEVETLRRSLERREHEAKTLNERSFADHEELRRLFLARDREVEELRVSLQKAESGHRREESLEAELQVQVEQRRRLSAQLERMGSEADELRTRLREAREEIAWLWRELQARDERHRQEKARAKPYQSIGVQSSEANSEHIRWSSAPAGAEAAAGDTGRAQVLTGSQVAATNMTVVSVATVEGTRSLQSECEEILDEPSDTDVLQGLSDTEALESRSLDLKPLESRPLDSRPLVVTRLELRPPECQNADAGAGVRKGELLPAATTQEVVSKPQQSMTHTTPEESTPEASAAKESSQQFGDASKTKTEPVMHTAAAFAMSFFEEDEQDRAAKEAKRLRVARQIERRRQARASRAQAAALDKDRPSEDEKSDAQQSDAVSRREDLPLSVCREGFCQSAPAPAITVPVRQAWATPRSVPSLPLQTGTITSRRSAGLSHHGGASLSLPLPLSQGHNGNASALASPLRDTATSHETSEMLPPPPCNPPPLVPPPYPASEAMRMPSARTSPGQLPRDDGIFGQFEKDPFHLELTPVPADHRGDQRGDQRGSPLISARMETASHTPQASAPSSAAAASCTTPTLHSKFEGLRDEMKRRRSTRHDSITQASDALEVAEAVIADANANVIPLVTTTAVAVAAPTSVAASTPELVAAPMVTPYSQLGTAASASSTPGKSPAPSLPSGSPVSSALASLMGSNLPAGMSPLSYSRVKAVSMGLLPTERAATSRSIKKVIASGDAGGGPGTGGRPEQQMAPTSPQAFYLPMSHPSSPSQGSAPPSPNGGRDARPPSRRNSSMSGNVASLPGGALQQQQQPPQRMRSMPQEQGVSAMARAQGNEIERSRRNTVALSARQGQVGCGGGSARVPLGQPERPGRASDIPVDMERDMLHEAVVRFCTQRPPGRFPLVRLSKGVYLYGNKKLVIAIHNEKLMVRIGGGFVNLESYILDADRNAPVATTPVPGPRRSARIHG